MDILGFDRLIFQKKLLKINCNTKTNATGAAGY